MIPLKDNNPTRSFPAVTLLIIVTNILVFLVQKRYGPVFDGMFSMIPREVTTNQIMVGVLHGQSGRFTPAPPDQPLYYDPATEEPIGPCPIPPWMTIFTAMFMHANLLHIASNMWVFWIFGNNVEDALGKIRYLFFYLFCGVAAAIAQIAIDPMSPIPTLGASGAIAGVMAAYIVLFPRAQVFTLIFVVFLFFFRTISAFWVIAIWIGIQVLQGFTGLGDMDTGGVAYFAHIGGFFTGLAVIHLLGGQGLARPPRRSGEY